MLAALQTTAASDFFSLRGGFRKKKTGGGCLECGEHRRFRFGFHPRPPCPARQWLNRNSREFSSPHRRSCPPSFCDGAAAIQSFARVTSSARGGRDSVTRYSSSTTAGTSALSLSNFSTR